MATACDGTSPSASSRTPTALDDADRACAQSGGRVVFRDARALRCSHVDGVGGGGGDGIGHFERRLPEGYLETLSTGQMAIRDPGLTAFTGSTPAFWLGPMISAQSTRMRGKFSLPADGRRRLFCPQFQ
jgi:hypothetical protein